MSAESNQREYIRQSQDFMYSTEFTALKFRSDNVGLLSANAEDESGLSSWRLRNDWKSHTCEDYRRYWYMLWSKVKDCKDELGYDFYQTLKQLVEWDETKFIRGAVCSGAEGRIYVAAVNVEHFLQTRSTLRGLDQDIIYSIGTVDQSVDLTKADLDCLIYFAKREILKK